MKDSKTPWEQIQHKIQDSKTAQKQVQQWKKQGQKIVFTNGCFDLLHLGHLRYLADAKALGDVLVVGLNDDASVQRLKGDSRPVKDWASRSHTLAALEMVDVVVPFSADTPLAIIQLLLPHILVKGGDYTLETIVGHQEVLAHGGEVKVLPFVSGFSTTHIVEKLKK